MSRTSPLYLFSGTTTLKATTRESVGPRRGVRSDSTSVMITVRATDQADAERAAGAVLTTPPDSGDRSDGTTYRRTYSWDVVTPCDPEPVPAAQEAAHDCTECGQRWPCSAVVAARARRDEEARP